MRPHEIIWDHMCDHYEVTCDHMIYNMTRTCCTYGYAAATHTANRMMRLPMAMLTAMIMLSAAAAMTMALASHHFGGCSRGGPPSHMLRNMASGTWCWNSWIWVQTWTMRTRYEMIRDRVKPCEMMWDCVSEIACDHMRSCEMIHFEMLMCVHAIMYEIVWDDA